MQNYDPVVHKSLHGSKLESS